MTKLHLKHAICLGSMLPLAALASTTLTNGMPESNISGASGSEQFYTLEVEANATDLNFVTSGGSGDVDLYVKFGSQPTTSSYDCRPYRSGNNETCDIASAQQGTYHVMLKGYSAYSGVELQASYQLGATPPPSNNQMENNTPITGLSGAAAQELSFTLEVPAGAGSLSFDMSGGTGDADLYVRFGSPATTSDYDCRPYAGGNNESCPMASAQTGTYHVMIRGYSSFSNVTLVGSYQEDGDTGPAPVIGVHNTAAAGDSITRAFAADCTYNTTWWGLLCPGSGDQPHHSWFDGSSSNVNSVHDKFKAVDATITADKSAATTGAELVGIREDGSEPSFAAQAQSIVNQSPTPDHVELIFGGNDLCSRDCLDPNNCNDPIYTDEEWRQALRTGLNTLINGMPQGGSILVGSVPRVQDIYQAGIDKQNADEWVNCESLWSSYDVCSIVTQPGTYNSETQSERLAGVAAAQQRYNAILAEEAAAYNANSNGLNDKGIEVVAEYVDEATPSGGTFAFGAEHINGGDCFHPNVSTQNLISDLMWNANPAKPQE